MLVALHGQDREAFESLRRQLLRQAVDAAPAARRADLERLLCKIEATRTAAATPQQAATLAFGMMGESLKELQQSWQQACYALSGLQARLLIERVR